MGEGEGVVGGVSEGEEWAVWKKLVQDVTGGTESRGGTYG